MSEEALKIAEKRREAKGKGEKERYTHLNIEFQRIARRDKKTFLSDQCKKIEESNRMGKTRDLFKKIRDTKGKIYAKMGTIKNKNTMDLTETEGIKKRQQEYTEELYKKHLHDPDNHDAVIIHLGCFYVLVIVSSAAMNNGIHVSFTILVSSGYMPRNGISTSYGGLLLVF